MDERDREDNSLREWGLTGVGAADPAAEAARRRAEELAAERARQQAAEAIPADAVFYVGIDLDPSAEQKINALRFLNHFPAFKGDEACEGFRQ